MNGPSTGWAAVAALLPSLALAAATLGAGQGSVVRLGVPHEPGLTAVEAQWRGVAIPLAQRGDWFAPLGVDLDAEPGAHAVGIELAYADGSAQSRSVSIEVTPRSFPTTRLSVEPKYVELSAAALERTARERAEIDAIYARVTPVALWVDPFAVPIAGATGGRNFGHRRVFNDQPRAPHSGADLTAAAGTPVRAANRGRVVLAKALFFGGNAVFLDHGLGVYTVYLHLSQIGVEPGQLVEREQVIGRAGATGRVTGPHLHWGARVQGARVDPFTLLDLGRE